MANTMMPQFSNTIWRVDPLRVSVKIITGSRIVVMSFANLGR